MKGEPIARLAACLALFGVAFRLAHQSPFAMRLRDDFPAIAPGFDAPTSAAILLAAALAAIPLVARPERFVAAFITASFLAAGVGGYWWTRIPWDELITRSRFPADTTPSIVNFFWIATPILVLAAYLAASARWRMQADHAARGADPAEVLAVARGATAQSALSGAMALTLAGIAWLALSTGALGFARDALPGGALGLALAATALIAGVTVASGRFRRLG